MKNIIEIYDKYKIRPNLQEHMLRVAAVASLICDNLKSPIPKKQILLMCLLHDMGNILKYQALDYYPEFVKLDGVEHWEGVREEFREKYGDNEDGATLQIVNEIGMDLETLKEFKLFILSEYEDFRKVDNLAVKVCKYSDMRVSPFGVLPLLERLKEWQKRNPKMTEEYMEKVYEIISEVEEQIFKKCKIKPEDITDEAIAPIILELKNFVIE